MYKKTREIWVREIIIKNIFAPVRTNNQNIYPTKPSRNKSVVRETVSAVEMQLSISENFYLQFSLLQSQLTNYISKTSYQQQFM